MKKEPELFNAEYQYRLYLEMSEIDESKLDPIKREMVRDAFFRGIGQCLFLITQKLSEYPDDLAFKKLEKFSAEIGDIVVNDSYKWN